MKPENQFISSVHTYLPPASQVYRMKNNNEYIAGVADCWYSAKKDLWVEWKFIVVPKRADTIIDLVGGKNPALSALQQEWLRRRHAEGRNVWVGVGCKDGGLFLHDLEWEKPMTTETFRGYMCSRKSMAAGITNFVLELGL